jgi:hypothetical protein
MRTKLLLAILLCSCGGSEREPGPRLVGQPSSGVGITTAVLDCDTLCPNDPNCDDAIVPIPATAVSIGMTMCDPPPTGCILVEPWSRTSVRGSTLAVERGRLCTFGRTFKVHFITGGI